MDNKQNENNKKNSTYQAVVGKFVADTRSAFKAMDTEINKRNALIVEHDDYVYGDRLEKSLDIPIGHDATSVNWLRRTVEIHKNMFMGRGFNVVSTYDSQDSSMAADDKDRERIEIENKKSKEYAEQRQKLIRSIIDDNGGDAFWSALAENSSAVGTSAIKAYYDEEEKKYELCEIESIENLYVIWSKDDFREAQAYAYVYQITKQEAISEYGAPQDVATSPLGRPLDPISTYNNANQTFTQEMVTVLEVTGILEGWKADDGKIVPCKIGEEKPLNALIIGDKITRLISDEKKIPKYYILPNKRQRRRPWGMSDISDAAININMTYIETLSDWRTLASKVNFQKFKAFGFGFDTQMPKPAARAVEYLPLSEGQDIVPLQSGDANGLDFGRQMDELKEQFVRETGISRVLFDDPSVTLNSNQALMTSMKPTSDIAEAKKQLWGPVIKEIFTDALETIANYIPDVKDLVDKNEDWSLKVMWPSVMQKEDPVYQQMLLNRFNTGTMSMQTYLEAQGETKEEIDRIRDEMNDPITAAVLGKQLPAIAQMVIQATTAELQASLAAAFPEIFGQQEQGPAGQPAPQDGGAQPGPVATQAENVPGTGPVSQPGSGATAVSPQGAINQTNQQMGG
jgi:hypothetical protein